MEDKKMEEQKLKKRKSIKRFIIFLLVILLFAGGWVAVNYKSYFGFYDYGYTDEQKARHKANIEQLKKNRW